MGGKKKSYNRDYARVEKDNLGLCTGGRQRRALLQWARAVLGKAQYSPVLLVLGMSAVASQLIFTPYVKVLLHS